MASWRFAPLALVGVVACAAGDEPLGAVDADTAHVDALVVVEQTRGPGATAHGSLAARVARVRGTFEPSALDALAGAPPLPADGTCARLDDLAPHPGTSHVELLDVGAVTVVADDEPVATAARRIPDVTDSVTGVVYATREVPPATSSLRVVARGSAELSPFAVELRVASPMQDVRLEGVALGSPVAVSASRDAASLALSWDAANAADRVYVDVYDADATTLTRCAGADVGALRLPTHAFGRSGTIAVHRVRSTPIVANALDRGLAIHDVASVHTYVRR